MSERLFLRSDAVVEPLVDQWYAWLHLVPPLTAGLNVAERHLKIMESYVENPDVHAIAARTPELVGGPFVNHPKERVPEIRALLAQTKVKRSRLLALAAAVQELSKLLRVQAKGSSLEPFYSQVPGPLRGYVELVYDADNRATFRAIEPLLYRSPYYDPSAQSLMLSIVPLEQRAFMLSTPRLAGPGDVHVPLPFADDAVDWLAGLRDEPRSVGEIRERLGFAGESAAVLESLLTPQAPPVRAGFSGPGVRCRNYGHACILLETEGLSVLLDPAVNYGTRSSESGFTLQDLPARIDYVLITHGHQDHAMFEALLQLRRRTRNVVVPRCSGGSLQDPSLKLALQEIGFRNVVELGELESIQLEGGSITSIPFFGEHGDLDVRGKTAYVVRIGRFSAMFAADSRNVEPALYEHVFEMIGPLETLFIGMECDGAPVSWAYGPVITAPLSRSMDQSRRVSSSDYERALDMVRRFEFEEVYVYAMGQEPWLRHVTGKKYAAESKPIVDSGRLIAACRELGIAADRLVAGEELVRATDRARGTRRSRVE